MPLWISEHLSQSLLFRVYLLTLPPGWASVMFLSARPSSLLIYFKMQLGDFKFEEECSLVFSLSSSIYQQPAEEMWLSSPQPNKMIFLSHNASPVSHTIVVNFLSAQHPMPFFREYDSIWMQVHQSGTNSPPVPNSRLPINTNWPSGQWHALE